MNNRDYFDDVEGLVDGLGGLFEGSAGLGEMNRVTHQMSQDGAGFVYRVQCENCGRAVSLLVTWPEFIYMGNRRLPIDPRTRQPWRYDAHSGTVSPNAGCGGCRRAIPIAFTADEGQKRVQEGVAAQKLSPQYIQQVEQHLARQR